jgi:hypothetical protein
MRELEDEVLFKMRRRQKEDPPKDEGVVGLGFGVCNRNSVDEERLAFFDGGGVWRLPIPVLSWC